MKQVEVSKIIEPMPASDGAGVKLKRSIGTPLVNYFDPFLMLDEFGSENKDDYIGGFPPHPHRGIETVTYMLNGEFEHEDSTGAKGKMSSGDVQWMKTGGGIIHSEMPAMSEGKLHGFQLWVNMPAKLKMSKPENICFMSSNTWDVSGGGVFGFNAVWVNRFDKVFDKLSYKPKFVIKNLKELLKII